MPGHFVDQTPQEIAERIRRSLCKSAPRTVPAWRRLRREWSRELKSRPASDVIAIALQLLDVTPWGRFTAYELIEAHAACIDALTPDAVERMGEGIGDWATVDTFACYVAGPAWRERRIPARQVHGWLRSSDRWQRRAAVVSTVALNVRARGGRGDVKRTLEVCRRVVKDRDDMVVKALSWSLRSLIEWDRAAVVKFVQQHEDVLAARVKREVGTKIRTGRKNRRPLDTGRRAGQSLRIANRSFRSV